VGDDERMASALVAAARNRAPIPPLTDDRPEMTALDAYRIQQLVVAERLPAEGPKIGRAHV